MRGTWFLTIMVLVVLAVVVLVNTMVSTSGLYRDTLVLSGIVRTGVVDLSWDFSSVENPSLPEFPVRVVVREDSWGERDIVVVELSNIYPGINTTRTCLTSVLRLRNTGSLPVKLTNITARVEPPVPWCLVSITVDDVAKVVEVHIGLAGARPGAQEVTKELNWVYQPSDCLKVYLHVYLPGDVTEVELPEGQTVKVLVELNFVQAV